MNTIDNINTQIAAAEVILAKAQPLADKLAEMQAAAARVAQAERTLAVLRTQLAETEGSERARAAAMTRCTVEGIKCADPSPNAAKLHTVILTERYTGIYGPDVRTQRLPLHSLPAELLALIVGNPDTIPAYIRALDADPEQALRKHARAVNRGYLSA